MEPEVIMALIAAGWICLLFFATRYTFVRWNRKSEIEKKLELASDPNLWIADRLGFYALDGKEGELFRWRSKDDSDYALFPASSDDE
jgi:hypothetical protein